MNDLLSSASALKEVCEVENALFAMEGYDKYCYDEPSTLCLLGGLCASAAKSYSSETGRSCSPPLVSPLAFFYQGWQPLPNTTVLLHELVPGLRPVSEWPVLAMEAINRTLGFAAVITNAAQQLEAVIAIR